MQGPEWPWRYYRRYATGQGRWKLAGASAWDDMKSWPSWAAAGGVSSTRPGTRRSEERRVGKECSARWSPYRQKKNWAIAHACVWKRRESGVIYAGRPSVPKI